MDMCPGVGWLVHMAILFLFYLYFYKFIYFNLFLFLAALGFVAVRWLSLVAASGGYSSLWCVGFSLRWLLLWGAWALGSWASVVVACGLSSCGLQALERRLSSCCARA